MNIKPQIKLLYGLLFAIVLTVISYRSAQAYDQSQCQNEAYAFDPTGAAAAVCPSRCSSGNHYGAMYFKSSEYGYPEYDGIASNITAALYGRVYNCDGKIDKFNAVYIKFPDPARMSGTEGLKQVGWDAYDISGGWNPLVTNSYDFAHGPGNTGATLTRPSNNVTSGWNYESEGSLTAILRGDLVKQFQCNSTNNGLCVSNNAIWIYRCTDMSYRGLTESSCKANPSNFGYYKITNIIHSTSSDYNVADRPTIIYGGKTYYNGDTISVDSANDTITFEHKLKRSDGWGGFENIDNLYALNGSNTYSSLNNMTTTSYSTVKDYKSGPWSSSEQTVCSTLDHYTVKGLYNYNAPHYEKSQSRICVKVKIDALSAKSYSAVSTGISTAKVYSTNAPNIASVSNTGGSQQSSYTFNFYHGLNVSGNSLKSASFNYTIYTSNSSAGPWTPISGASGQQIISGDSGDIQVRSSSQPVTINFGESRTICEKIEFSPTYISGSGNASGSGSSIACATIVREKPDSRTITATTDVIADNDGDKNPTAPKFSTSATRDVTFYHSFKNDHTSTLNTNYTIEFQQDGGPIIEYNRNTSISTPTSSPVIHTVKNIQVSEAGQTTVCERVRFTSANFFVHTDGSTQPFGDTGYSDWRCITLVRPGKKIIDDGEFTIYGTSTGSLKDPSQTGGFSTALNAWLMKGPSADITFEHTLTRDNVTHQNDPSVPAEDVTVKYRFGDPSNSFSTAYMQTTGGLGSTTVRNNSTAGPFLSDPTDPLFNANTKATAEIVGQRYSYCQSIFFHSERYALRGQYWIVGDQIYDKSPGMISAAAPEMLPRPNGSVGSSAAERLTCVDVIRPYNFHVTDIHITDQQSTAQNVAIVGTNYETQFIATVNKNDPDYLITDIPNATIRYVGFVIDGNAATYNFKGAADSASDPCSFFTFGTSCQVIKEDTQNLGPSDAAPTGKKFYTNRNQYSTANLKVSYTIPNLATSEKYCVAVGILPSNSGDGLNFSNHWTISNASCVNVGKYPNFQVWGGSVFTNGGTKTSLTKNNDHTFGSWSDFAIIANQTISKTASGATLISGLAGRTNCNSSPLTIANDNCSASDNTRPAIGGAGIVTDSAGYAQKLFDRYITDPSHYIDITANPVVNNSTLTSGRNPYVIYNSDPSKSIYITYNVTVGTASRSYANKNIPQVIIYSKGNIVIDQVVSKVNAWLIAEGDLNTCVDSSLTTPSLSASTCNNDLVISGPVLANHVYFNRTFGADANKNTLPNPAEIVDLNPAVYLFSANEASGAQPITTYLQKLPPRY